MAKPPFQEQLSQLLSSYLQQTKTRERSVEGFQAFLADPTSGPTAEDSPA